MNYEMTPEVQAKVRAAQAAKYGEAAMDFVAMETIAIALFEENAALIERQNFFVQVNSDLMGQVDGLRAERDQLRREVAEAQAPKEKAKKARK